MNRKAATVETVRPFVGTGNPASPDEGHGQKLMIQFQDKDHIIEHWTWRSNGKDTEMVYPLARRTAKAE